MRASRTVLITLAAFACVTSAACKRDSSNVAQNPDCPDDLGILAIDAGAGSVATADASTGAVAPVAGADGGRSGGVVYSPCGVAGATGDDDNADYGEDASPGIVVCPSYTCVCVDTTTQTGSDADPATGMCEAEAQVCAIICTSHGGWM